MNFAQNLKTLRKRAGLSQREMAEQIGLKQYAIAKYETGLHEPTLHKAAEIARVLHTTLDALCGNPIDASELEQRPRRNTRTAQMEEVFALLKPQEQRILLQQAKGLRQRSL